MAVQGNMVISSMKVSTGSIQLEQIQELCTVHKSEKRENRKDDQDDKLKERQ